MLLTEEHLIKRSRNKALYRELDAYCYRAKNLYNATNYLIRQCDRIHRKLQSGKTLLDWEAELAEQVNEGLRLYYLGRGKSEEGHCVDEKNGFVADAYFLSWYLKTSPEYKAMPYATSSQICIQELCRAWKSYYKAASAHRSRPGDFLGRPRKPGYLDPKEGRGWLVITSQNFRAEKDGTVRMPGFLKGIKVKARHKAVRQIRVKTEWDSIRVLLVYKQEELPGAGREGEAVMGIDLGVNNLVTAVWNTRHAPVIINGKGLKSINQYYNRKRARLQADARKGNRKARTRRISRLTRKRNHKVRDYLHKASRKLICLAGETGTGMIVIGNNRGWKQNVKLGNITNQNFVSIPYRTLIEMIRYKAALAGITVKVTEEAYTSGTSYLDGEKPEKQFYNRSRRIHRGLFRSNNGKFINADVNAAYQIMKSGGTAEPEIKEEEPVTRIKVA